MSCATVVGDAHRPALRRTASDASSNTVPLSATESFSSSFTSTASSATSRGLLFGEIPSISDLSVTTSYRRKKSVCNLVLSSSPAFLRFWLSPQCRDRLVANLDRATLADFRLVCHDFSSKAAPKLFDVIGCDFKASSFTRPSRIAALERVGQHVRTFTFSMPHSPATVLPPLIDPKTGMEQEFIYTPQIFQPSTLIGKVKEPKYGTWELTDLLIRQYPPLFHAATNVPAFAKVFEHIPHLEHLKISCPDAEHYSVKHRSIVDFALVSLRIVIETASLTCLDSLSLINIHPIGLSHLTPLQPALPALQSLQVRSKISKLSVRIQNIHDEHGSAHHSTMKLLREFVSTLAPGLTHLAFFWSGLRGPSPFGPSLQLSNAMSHPAMQGMVLPNWVRTDARKETYTAPYLPCQPAQDTCTSASPSRIIIPGPTAAPGQPLSAAMYLPNLTHLIFQNVAASAAEIAEFLARHRRTLIDVSLNEIALYHGSWDQALLPLVAMGKQPRKRVLRQRQTPPISHEIGSGLFGEQESPLLVQPLDLPLRPDRVGGCRPISIRACSTTHSACRESMEVPIMFFEPPISTQSTLRYTLPLPEQTEIEPVVAGPLFCFEDANTALENRQSVAKVTGPLKRWLSRRKPHTIPEDTRERQAARFDLVDRIFRDGFWKR